MLILISFFVCVLSLLRLHRISSCTFISCRSEGTILEAATSSHTRKHQISLCDLSSTKLSQLLNLAPITFRGKEFLSLITWHEKTRAFILSHPTLFHLMPVLALEETGSDRSLLCAACDTPLFLAEDSRFCHHSIHSLVLSP